jgi:hypothetical protein
VIKKKEEGKLAGEHSPPDGALRQPPTCSENHHTNLQVKLQKTCLQSLESGNHQITGF